MATLSITRTFSDGSTLFEADLDSICDGVETFLNSTKINDDNIQDDGITASDKLVDGTVTAAKLGTDSVTTIKILDSNVTTAKIADSNITTVKIADLNVTTAKIAAGAVTQAKRVALGQQISSSSGVNSTSSGTYADVTNLTVTITTTGRPVWVGLIPDSAGSDSTLPVLTATTTGTQAIARYKIVRDSTDMAFNIVTAAAGGNGSNTLTNTIPVGALNTVDPVAAGTYTYKVQYKATTGVAIISYCKLLAFEL